MDHQEWLDQIIQSIEELPVVVITIAFVFSFIHAKFR